MEKQVIIKLEQLVGFDPTLPSRKAGHAIILHHNCVFYTPIYRGGYFKNDYLFA